MESMILIKEVCKMFSMKSKDNNRKSAYGKKEVLSGLNTFLRTYQQSSNTVLQNNVSQKSEKISPKNKSKVLAEAMNRLR